MSTPQHRVAAMAQRQQYLTHAAKVAEYSDEFYTPDEIPRALGKFDLDPCAGPKSHACINIRRPECGLAVPWFGRVWLNPPYLHIHQWLERFEAHGNGVLLVNGRCETRWFQRAAAKATCMLFLQGRIEFDRPDKARGRGPVGSVLIEMGGDSLRKSGLKGIVVKPLRSLRLK